MKNNLSMANATIEELSHALKLEKNQKVCSSLLFQCIPLIVYSCFSCYSPSSS
jgi:hypothetical protein